MKSSNRQSPFFSLSLSSSSIFLWWLMTIPSPPDRFRFLVTTSVTRVELIGRDEKTIQDGFSSSARSSESNPVESKRSHSMQDLVKTRWHEFHLLRVGRKGRWGYRGNLPLPVPEIATLSQLLSPRVNLVSRHFGDSSSLPSVGGGIRGKRDSVSHRVLVN